MPRKIPSEQMREWWGDGETPSQKRNRETIEWIYIVLFILIPAFFVARVLFIGIVIEGVK